MKQRESAVVEAVLHYLRRSDALAFLLADQSNRPLPHLRGKPRCLAHDRILSRDSVSCNPGGGSHIYLMISRQRKRLWKRRLLARGGIKVVTTCH